MSYSNAKTFFLALCVLLALSSTPTSAQSNVFDQLNPFGKNVCFSSSEFGAACVQATCDNTADEEGNTECTCYVVATTSDGAQLGECARCGYCDDEELFYDCTNVEGLDSGAKRVKPVLGLISTNSAHTQHKHSSSGKRTGVGPSFSSLSACSRSWDSDASAASSVVRHKSRSGASALRLPGGCRDGGEYGSL
eukprot:CAMPEP_0194027008 /NCGR_PEP_ID=MMETSP0009_2-20130614/1242_1 /TAXON_ID=210454 /ORGANISM="Grammatophora oceanica, Strain CCMP 410" /LENGTH=192 /DNA_ID=CAMNT_0038665931 /DNA_START=47 /DNA_END=626 /DNA_ORIENTATION=-